MHKDGACNSSIRGNLLSSLPVDSLLTPSSSPFGVAPLPGVAHVAGKGGVLAMTRQLAMEGREAGIRVNSISPGVIETLQTAPHKKDGNWSEAMLKKIMLGRFGQPEEVVAVARFLASIEASYITGADIRIEGGLTAGSTKSFAVLVTKPSM